MSGALQRPTPAQSQCSMIARAVLALLSLLGALRAQSIWVDVAPTKESGDVENRYTPELIEELQQTKADALLLYTEFSARSGIELKMFIRNISGLTNETVTWLGADIVQRAPKNCRDEFEERLKKIEYNAHKAAFFSSENHHKFFLGHMIVFRMHLNKSENYISKCENVVNTCGVPCETIPKVIRWRRLAAEEINRVREDLQNSRRYYKDLLSHAHRRLNTLRRQATSKAKEAVAQLEVCTQRG